MFSESRPSDCADVVGYYWDQSNTLHGFTRSCVDGGFTTIDCTGTAETLLTSVNDDLQYGGLYTNDFVNFNGFLYSNGACIPIAASWGVNGLNNNGELVGVGLNQQGFISQDLGIVGLGLWVSGGVNGEGEIVGEYLDGSGVTQGFIGKINTNDDDQRRAASASRERQRSRRIRISPAVTVPSK